MPRRRNVNQRMQQRGGASNEETAEQGEHEERDQEQAQEQAPEQDGSSVPSVPPTTPGDDTTPSETKARPPVEVLYCEGACC